jgi:2-oxoglutarate ferredoxin oxidoreductase subunit beta
MSAVYTLKDYKTDEKSWWCPGCGDFGVLAALQKALVELNLAPHEVVIVAGIGCSGKIGNYINSYNFHVVHGRTLPTAMGVKLANRRLTVLAVGGDGDGFAIGMSHFLHAVRRNVDVTYITMDNHIYGLTKGQNSPTSDRGAKAKASPAGSIESPIRPLSLAVTGGCTWVAQGFSARQQQLVRLMKEAIQHEGFSFLNTISPCVTYNKVNTYDWYKDVLVDLDEDEGYRADDRAEALRRLIQHQELVTGLVYREQAPSYEAQVPGFRSEPIVAQDHRIAREDWEALLDRYR